ncbi:MAG: prolyl oligopeptidase family serine peptidase [Pirellulales bacterium]|nr:prolyl oligopeptidase family serine peptidase [Pirellulales bacterium]
MIFRFGRAAVVGVFLAAMLCCSSFAGAETHSVTKTYNDDPFEYRISPPAERDGFNVRQIVYPSPVKTALEQNNTVPAVYYLPKQLDPNDKYPAVICLHILDGNEPLTDLVCSVLAKRGIPAISFKLPYYGSRGLPGKGPNALAKDPKMFLGAIKQSGEDVRRCVDLLASREEINPERIGITGISLGGIISATAAGAEPRLHRAGLMLAGGDLQRIIHHARETRSLSRMITGLAPEDRAEVDKMLALVDPLHFAPALRERAKAGRVLMLNAAEDEVVPRQCTEKLAEALGIADRVVWFEGLGHYTAMAELPRALKITADFFAEDLPDVAQPPSAVNEPPSAVLQSPLQLLVSFAQQTIAMLIDEPAPGRCHYADLSVSVNMPNAKMPLEAEVRLVRGEKENFSLHCNIPGLGKLSIGQNGYPWLVAGGKKVLEGIKNPTSDSRPLGGVDPQRLIALRTMAGAVGAFAMAPQTLEKWINVENVPYKAATVGRAPGNATHGRSIRISGAPQSRVKGEILLNFRDDNRTPESASFSVDGVAGSVKFRGWQLNTSALEALFAPPADLPREEVEQTDLHRVFSAAVNFALDRVDPSRRPLGREKNEKISVAARDPNGHGLLCRSQGKTVLMVSGSPRQMGAAQGALVHDTARRMIDRVVYGVGGADTVHGGIWFFDRMAEIRRRTGPHIPKRFVEECDSLADAIGVSRRDALYGNLFPERFHCSGAALMGRATAGGRVLHARVLDYMRDIDLQTAALVQIFMPEGKNAWISHGYAGFVGTVTAMNEKGLAVGEIGGRGEGLWDGCPMSLMLRDVMERADNVEQALKIIEETPRTCEYHYVLSDASGEIRALHCNPQKVTVLKPGQQHPLLPHVPEDVVLISGDSRAKTLCRRIQENYGRIDVPKLIEIIKRPVAMRSNLHNAVFAPETLEMWVSDAGRDTPACDEPYARMNLRELMEFYNTSGRMQ